MTEIERMVNALTHAGFFPKNPMHPMFILMISENQFRERIVCDSPIRTMCTSQTSRGHSVYCVCRGNRDPKESQEDRYGLATGLQWDPKESVGKRAPLVVYCD